MKRRFTCTIIATIALASGVATVWIYRNNLLQFHSNKFVTSATTAKIGTRLTLQNIERHLDAVAKSLAEYRLSPTPHQIELQELCEKLRQR